MQEHNTVEEGRVCAGCKSNQLFSLSTLKNQYYKPGIGEKGSIGAGCKTKKFPHAMSSLVSKLPLHCTQSGQIVNVEGVKNIANKTICNAKLNRNGKLVIQNKKETYGQHIIYIKKPNCSNKVTYPLFCI
jgi:hypothetical protein